MNYAQYSVLQPGNYDNFIQSEPLNVFKAYKKPIESEFYIIKKYDDIVSYKREIDALIPLKKAKNIMQIIDYDLYKMVIVSECALYDLETFFEHQAWTQRQAEKIPIIKDIVNALSECQHKNIVHLDLSPKNIMYFCDENWKLIDFDSACIADKTYVSKTTTIKYCSPELIQAEGDGREIKAQFSMDMFSFGLILYYIENGYWNIADQKSPDKKLPITTTGDSYTINVIEKLLEKNVNNRMTLAQFKETTYYEKLSKGNIQEWTYHEKSKVQIEKEAKELNPDIKDDELKKMNLDLRQERFLSFLERYHQEMKISLNEMNEKLDEVKTSVLNLTETIPRMNEKTPRVFIMVPQRREFKNPMTWYTNPFKMYFVCEHNNHWHVPEQEGYVITKVPEFIKKYGPWIQLCNLFPQEIGNILSGVFNVKIDNSDEIVHYFQEIINTIGVGVKEINDINPDLVPLERDRESNYQVLNASGIRALSSFIKSKHKHENFGGLVQCIDKKNQNVIWLCDEHRNDNNYTLKDEPQSPHSTHPLLSCPSLPISKSNSEESMDIDGPVPLMNLVNEILLDVFDNALSSERIHFDTAKIKKETCNMRGNLKNLEQFYQNWLDALDTQQKELLKAVLNRYIIGYVYFLTVIYRYCYVKATNKLMNRTINCLNDLPIVNKILKATSALNEFYARLIKCLKNNNLKGIEQNLNKLNLNSKALNKISRPNKLMRNNILKGWYIIRKTSTIHDDDVEENECNGENEIDITQSIKDEISMIKNRRLKGNIPVFGKELDSKCFNKESNIDCIEKEIYMYSEQHLNDSDYILRFLGFTVDKFKPILHYEYANYGNLYKHLKNNQNLPENKKLTLDAKLNLSLDICLGLKFLHEKRILHLDLRSSNIYLFKNGYENEFLKPKISNFLHSVDTLNKYTTVKPCLPKSIDNQVRKRWHEPQRLENEKHNCTVESDYYSLGMLLWEIFNATGALPYEKIKIENLYEHLKNEREKFPKNLLPQYLINKITETWKYNVNERTTLATMITVLSGVDKRRSKRTTTELTRVSTTSTNRTVVNQQYLTESEMIIQKYSEKVDN
ncbi:13089_t:CDS:10 [Entrophospora sp. SA101]|nr:13089_t:CDS:10 [Entrophospora sp. SA101]